MLTYRIYQIKNKTSLQGKNICNGFIYNDHMFDRKGNDQNVNGACCFTSLRGSMTIESSFVVPLFLIAMVISMLFGEVIVIKSQMHHGLLEAAKIAAEEQYYAEKRGRSQSLAKVKLMQKKYSNKDNYPKLIQIRHLSFAGSKLLNDQDEVELHMKYDLLIEYPFLPGKQVTVTESVYQKAFTGYKPTAFESGEGYAYVTKYGNVYHQSIQCSHIMLRISGSKEVDAYLQGKTSYQPCSKCAKNCSGEEEQLYIPKEGNCYHTSLSCSGLIRLVRKVIIWEIEGMKPCSRCGN